MKIAIDLDGVLSNFEHTYLNLANKMFGVGIPMVQEYPEWGYVDKFLTKDQSSALWEEIKNDPCFWYELPVDNVSQQTFFRINNLQPNHEIYFITVRAGVEVKAQTEAWLRDHGIDNPTVLVVHDKGPVAAGLDLDVFIDDYPKNISSVLRNCGTLCRCYLRAKEYNKDFSHAYVLRVKDISTMLDMEKL